MNILFLGVGMQGKATLHDLVKGQEVLQVIAADANSHPRYSCGHFHRRVKKRGIHIQRTERDA